MLDSIELTNFQGHKSSRLDLHPGVNIIAGPSDNGKSTIIRGFNWVLFNRPQGTSFVRKGEKDASVAIETAGGMVVVRSRDPNENKYEIYDMEAPHGTESNPQVFRAIKSDVPEDVGLVLNMNDINLQKQGTPYFLLADTPGDVSRKLNQAANLDVIDAAQRKINSMSTTTKSKINYTVEQIDRLNADIDAMPDPVKLGELLDQLESALYDHQMHVEMRKLLQGDIDLALHLHLQIGDHNRIIQLKPTVDALHAWIDTRSKLDHKRRTLEDVYTHGDLETANLEAMPDTSKSRELLDTITPLLDARSGIAVRADLLEALIKQATHTADVLVPACDATMKAAKQELTAYMDSIDVCPLCNQEIPHADHGNGRPAPPKVIPRKPKG